MSLSPYGTVLSGGASTRYGSPKALASVGGRRIVDRVIEALGAVMPDLIGITNDPALGVAIGLPFRADVHTGMGALGGIHAALRWAVEDDRSGILAVACDMPFLEAALLQRLLDDAPNADVVVPESGGRRGIEPLCAWYGIGCLPAIESAIARGDVRVIAFHTDVHVRRIVRSEVERFGDPATLFLNVNTPEDHERAKRIARGAAA